MVCCMLAIVFLFVPYLLTFQKYYILLLKSFTYLLSHKSVHIFLWGFLVLCNMLRDGFPISKLLKCPVSTVWPGLVEGIGEFFLTTTIISQIYTGPGGKCLKLHLFW